MNRGQPALAAGAGLVSLVVFVGGGLAAMRLSFTQFGLIPFGGGQTLNPVVAILGILAVGVAVAFAFILPALALGAGWRRSLVAAVLGGILFLLLVAVVVYPTPFKIAWVFLAMAAAPALVSSVALIAVSPEAVRPAAILLLWTTALALCAVSFLIYSVFPQVPALGLILVLTSWPVLPALAALLHST